MKRRNAQDGFVSIVVCMIIMVILSLVTIGFATLMAREKRQALDRQLSTQAFYAAESGVNDAREDMRTGAAMSSTCNPADIASAVSSVRITCVQTNKEPQSLRYDSLSTSPKAIPLSFKDSAGNVAFPSSMTISWSPPAGTAVARSANGFPTANNWVSNVGLLKLYLFPYSSTHDGLVGSMGYALLYPGNFGASSSDMASIKGDGQGKIVYGGSCATSCTATINFMASEINSGSYMAIASEYEASNVDIVAYSSSGQALKFIGAQAIVDSTGKTTDVLRRIQVRVPLYPAYDYPNTALAGDICKLWKASPDTSTPGCSP